VGLVLLLLTSIFELLPMCIIGAIIISGVISLVDHPEAVRLWNFDKLDSCVWVVTFLGVLFLGAEIGLLCGVILSFLMFLARSAFPRTHIFGRLPGTDAYRSVRQYPEVESYPGCIVTGTDSPLYFLNAQLVKDRILRRAAEMDSETGVFTKYIVLDLAASSYIDTCALHEFDDWLLELSGGRGDGGGSIGGGPASRQLCLANPNRSVMRRMDQWGFVDRLGREYCFCTVQDAVTWCLSKMELEEAERRAETDTSTTPDTVDVQIVGRSLTVGSESASPGLDDAESGVDAPTSGTTVNYSMLEDGLHHRKTVT
jgi:sulfate transporter 4